MNRKILQKIIDALNKENVDISYVRGALETLIESLPEDKTVTSIWQNQGPTVVSRETADADTEAKALEYMARAKVEAVKQMADENQ